MIRMTLLTMAAAVAMGTASVRDVQAADANSTSAPALATTNELPAALQALNVNRTRIVTTVEAQQVRGEGGKGNAFGHYKGKRYGAGVRSGINFGIIGGHVVEVNIINSKNVRIGSHNHLKFK